MKYDVTIIGSGPGGYVAAIRAAQIGLKTAIIEKYATLGGTCLNVGCIPSKALLDSSEHFHAAQKNFKEHGIDINEPKVNFEQMINRKRDVVNKTCDGVAFLMKKNKIDVYQGVGSFIDKNNIKVTPTDSKGKETKIETDKVIIATGSKPTIFPFFPYDKKRFITSTEALELKEVPKRLIVIGGGVIGMELGSVYARLGTEVSVIEFMPSIIPTMDSTMGKELERVSKKSLKMKFFLQHKVEEAKQEGDEVVIKAVDKKGKEVEFRADYCLLAVGRSAYTQGLGLENIGIKTDKRGMVEVNDHLETSVKGVYAIGDEIGRAHV